MSWFKVDDRFGSNRKILLLPREIRCEAVGAWLLAGVWSAAHNMSGTCPRHVLEELGVRVQIVSELVRVRMWDKVQFEGLDAIAFHDWDVYQIARDQGSIRDKWREDKQRQRLSGRVSDMSKTSSGSPPPPDPTRPVPKKDHVQTFESDFEDWYAVYPRHEAKERARASYRKAREHGVSREELIDGASRYRHDPNRDPSFTKLPSTWLNGGCWTDDPLPARDGAVPETPRKSMREKYPDAS